MDHRQDEEALGEDIWPATPAHIVNDKNQEDVDFCSSLDRAACEGGKAELAW